MVEDEEGKRWYFKEMEEKFRDTEAQKGVLREKRDSLKEVNSGSCSRTSGAARRYVLDFLANADVGRTSGPLVAGEEDEAASEASEWEAREQAERGWERTEEEVRLGAEL